MATLLHWHKLYRNSTFHLSKFCVSHFTCSTKAIHASLTVQPLLSKSSLPALVSTRTFWETFPTKSLSYYDKDGLDRSRHVLVYRASIFNYVFYAQLVSLNIFALQIYAVLRYVYNTFVTPEAVEVVMHIGSYPIVHNTFSTIVLGIFSLQNVGVYLFAQRSVLRIYYDEGKDKYTVVSLGVNPFKSRLVKMKPGQLVPRQVGKILKVFGNHKFKNRIYIISQERFKDMMFYYKMVHNEREFK